MYNWQLDDWTKFSYETSNFEEKLFLFSAKVGQLTGFSKGISTTQYTQTLLDMLVQEAIKTSEIEGEFVSRKDVVSSVKNNLGLQKTPKIAKDKRAVGIANLVTEIQQTYAEKLTATMLYKWHKLLMNHKPKITIGKWRSHKEPMQVVSGSHGREKVHFIAPPSESVHSEMKNFIEWFNNTAPNGKEPIKHPAIRASIAHLYFESIHPFEDGNGRIGRALAEKALLQSVGHPLLISLSTTIEANKKAYYSALQNGQKSNEITNWINYFIDVILESQERTTKLINFTLQKTRFFDTHKNSLNERQIKVIRRMLAEGIDGFEGGMTAKKYMKIAKTTKPTATRDLQKLVKLNIFKPFGGGRSTCYILKIDV